jgi:hypothetical protein
MGFPALLVFSSALSIIAGYSPGGSTKDGFWASVS